jgi:hypothetical protein
MPQAGARPPAAAMPALPAVRQAPSVNDMMAYYGPRPTPPQAPQATGTVAQYDGADGYGYAAAVRRDAQLRVAAAIVRPLVLHPLIPLPLWPTSLQATHSRERRIRSHPPS